MRKYIIVALILVVLGVGVSFLLVPTQDEVMQLQARDATQVDLGNIDVEAEYAQGRRSFIIINALVDKRLTEGNRPAAITILEEYVATNPKDVNGRKRLAEQYQLSGDYLKYNQQLEEIASAEPTEANLKILSDIYNAEKSYPKQIEILKRLIEVTGGANPVYYADLATIQMVESQTDDALLTIEQLRAKHPDYNTYATTRIYVSALASKGELDRAVEATNQWIALNPAPEQLADFVNIIHYTGKDAVRAIGLVEPRMDLLTKDAALVLAYVNANITAGRDDHAYDVLMKVDQAGTMPASLYAVYLELAIKREDFANAENIVAKLDPQQFTEEQALNIIELARAMGATKTLGGLTTRFQEPGILDSRPVLASVIAIITNAKDQDDKIATALALDLSSTQRLRMAEACARANKTKCFDELVKKFPPIDMMTPAQVAEYAQLFIVADRAGEIVDAVGVKARANPVYETNHAHLRLAAASGRNDIFDVWLEPNAQTAALSSLQEYFYLANDRGHGAIAGKIARILYQRDPSPANRDIMIAAFIKGGNEREALALLREQIKEEGANDALYVSTLSKLARKDKEARSELIDYAMARLKASKGTNAQQLNYAYALINHGQRANVLPVVRDKAKSEGGEWRKMLAQLTPSKGGPSKPLTREQYLAMAKRPGITAANKRQIAFNLMNMGHKADATALFEEMAEGKSPESQEVKDLMFVWGGKLDDRQFTILANRATAANNFDKQGWQNLLNQHGTDAQVMRYVAKDPQALYNSNLRKKYFRLLALNESPQIFDAGMRSWVDQTSDADALRDYALIASAYGYSDAANRTYLRISQVSPNDKDALTRLGANYASKGQFTKARPMIDRALSIPSTTPVDMQNDAQAHFYRAELFKRDKQTDAAMAEYRKVVEMESVRFEREGTLPLDSLTRMNAALFHIGRQQEARAGFERLLQQNPTDKGLLADYMGILLEYDYVQDAMRIANQYDNNSILKRQQSRIQGASPNISRVETSSDGRRITLSFSKPVDGTSPLKLPKNSPAWMEEARADYDSITVAAKHGYELRYVPTSSDTFEIVSTPQLTAQERMERDQTLRLQLLYARLEQEIGEPEKARARLAAVEQYYPKEPQIIAARASIESAEGNPFEALDLIRNAQTLAPENEDYIRLADALGKSGGAQNYVRADHEYRSFGKNDEQITTLSAVSRISNRVEIGTHLKNNYMQTEQIRQPDTGRIGDYDTSRQQAEIYAAYYLDGGARAQLSLFANNDTPGAGLYYGFKNRYGRTEVLGEFHRPYWDFPEAVFADANRDRVGIKHVAQLTPKTSFGLETSVNRYNTSVVDDAVNSGLIRMNLVHTLQDSGPYLGVGYGFDGEYLFGNRERRRDPTGFVYYPLPLISREVHAVTGIVRGDITPTTHGLLVAGYAYDRFTAGGPLVEGRLTQDITENVEAGVRARYGLQTNDANNNAVNVGGHLQYNF